MDVGVCHCVELSNSISQTLDGIFDHFKSLELSPEIRSHPGHPLAAVDTPKSPDPCQK